MCNYLDILLFLLKGKLSFFTGQQIIEQKYNNM